MPYPKLRGLISSAVLSISALGVSTCATANTSAPLDAVLLNPQDSATRQAIRVFVRDLSGSDILANPDSLAVSPELIHHRRNARSRGFGSDNSASSFKPVGNYRLVMDNHNRCFLIHNSGENTSYLELPASANCAVYSAG